MIDKNCITYQTHFTWILIELFIFPIKSSYLIFYILNGKKIFLHEKYATFFVFVFNGIKRANEVRKVCMQIDHFWNLNRILGVILIENIFYKN